MRHPQAKGGLNTHEDCVSWNKCATYIGSLAPIDACETPLIQDSNPFNSYVNMVEWHRKKFNIKAFPP